MSKRKMQVYILYFFIIFYLGTLAILYMICRQSAVDTFRYNSRAAQETLNKVLDASDGDEELSLYSLMQGHSLTYGVNSSAYDHQVFVTDPQGNLLYKSGTCLELNGSLAAFEKEGLGNVLKYDPGYNTDKDNCFYFINVKELLSPVAKESLRNAYTVKGYGLSNSINVVKMDYCIENDEIIPVTLWIQGDSMIGDDKNQKDMPILEINLSSKEAEKTLTSEWKENGLTAYFWPDYEDLNYLVPESCEASGRYYRQFEEDLKTDDDLKQAISFALDSAREDQDYGLYSTAWNDHSCQAIWSLKYRGKEYGLVFKTMQNPTYQTLHSSTFQASLFFESFLMAMLLIVAEIGSTILYQKNQQLNDARSAFTSATAHELKTPLAIIQNQCECIMEGVSPEKNPEYLASIYEESQRMNQLVLSFLQYNRLSQTKNIQVEKVDLSQLLREEINKYETVFESEEIPLKLAIEDGIMVKAEREMLAIAIDNYLSNAARYYDKCSTGNMTGDAVFAGDADAILAGGNNVTNKRETVCISLFSDSKNFHLQVNNPCAADACLNPKAVWSVMTKGDASRKREKGSSGMGLPTTAEILRLHKFRYGCQKQGAGRVEFYMEGKMDK